MPPHPALSPAKPVERGQSKAYVLAKGHIRAGVRVPPKFEYKYEALGFPSISTWLIPAISENCPYLNTSL